MANEQHRTWVVTLSGDRPVQEVVSDLKNAGLEVHHILEFTNNVIGSGADQTAEKARSISGVADVSPDQPIDIGPPDAPVS